MRQVRLSSLRYGFTNEFDVTVSAYVLIITPTSRVPSNCICSFVCFLCVCFSVFVVVDDICLLSPGVGNIWQ